MLNEKQPFKEAREIRLHYENPFLITEMTDYILHRLPVASNRDLIILCIGTDRSTGDSLGPLVGSFLKQRLLKNFKTFGWLHKPVHAMNLKTYLQEIYLRYTRPYILTIDAGLGRNKSVGQIVCGMGGIKPGSALKKDLPTIGHLHLVGVVNLKGFMEYAVLQNTRLSFVMDMAKK